MQAYRPVIASLSTVVALAGLMLVGARMSPAQLPLEPARESGQSVTGAYEGWYPNPDGSFTMLVGYFNRNTKQTLDIPVGPNNRIEPGGPDQGQPTHFLTRRQWGVFTVTVPKDFGNKKLTWTLAANGETTVIPMSLDPLWIVEPFKDEALKNTPPVVRFEPGGTAYQGPPRGLSTSLTAKAGDPVTLTLWAADDGIRAPEARARPDAPVATVTWSKFRGPAPVTFANARPELDKTEGKATTTATFNTPGEYILRAQVNDATGDGGGGFQCCWTNLHLKVTVNSGTSSR